MIITTTDTIQGREISEYLGLIETHTPYNKGGVGKFGGKMASANSSAAKEAIESAAAEIGADAVVGLKFFPDSPVMISIGTAVKLK